MSPPQSVHVLIDKNPPQACSQGLTHHLQSSLSCRLDYCMGFPSVRRRCNSRSPIGGQSGSGAAVGQHAAACQQVKGLHRMLGHLISEAGCKPGEHHAITWAPCMHQARLVCVQQLNYPVQCELCWPGASSERDRSSPTGSPAPRRYLPTSGGWLMSASVEVNYSHMR